MAAKSLRLAKAEARALAAENVSASLRLRLKEKDVEIRELKGQLEIARQDLIAARGAPRWMKIG